MSKKDILTGKRFGRLTVLCESHKDSNSMWYWKCLCDCGKETIVLSSNLRAGKTKSCGCLGRECKPPIKIKHGYLKHGERKEKLYNIWVSIKQRCLNPKDANYPRYGGRGIIICDEWKSDYRLFREWCISNGYREGLELDRKNNDAGYEPNNCRFISHKDNLRNTHRKLHDVIRGEDITIADAAEKYGISYNKIYKRYKRGKRGDDLIA